MSTAIDEPCGKWGDGNDGKYRKRAQFRQERHHPLHAEWGINFSILIPDDWTPSNIYTGVMDLHQYRTQGNTPWVLQIRGMEYRFKSAWGVEHKFIVVPEQWDDFRMEYQARVGTNGWVKLWRNGNLIVDETGIQTTYPDEKGNYFKIGPYIFQGGNPEDRTYRRLFVQLDLSQ